MDQAAILAHMMSQLGFTRDDMEQVMGLGTQPRHRRPPVLNPNMRPEDVKARMEEYKVWLEEESKLPPQAAPLVPRSALVSNQLGAREFYEQQIRDSEAGKISSRMTIVGFAKHSSMTPMKQLKPIAVSKMLVTNTHFGRYLLCRFIAPCVRMSAIQAVAEDPEGSAFTLSMYNFPGSFGCFADYLDALFPVGTIIAIREPTFKTATQGPYPIVRVDSPTDIIFVESHNQMFDVSHWSTRLLAPSPFPTTAEGWKARGNTFFKASQWLPAALAYSHGIALDRDAIVLYLNRSEAYLRLKFYSGALADARRVLSAPGISDAFRGKALAREGKAEYARGNFQDAERKFYVWSQIHPDDKEIPAWIIRCQQRIKESCTGEYDWARLFKSSLTDPHLDVADYQGPIEVRQVQGRGGGRGVVAMRDIKVGELLLVSKPFVGIYTQDLRAGELMLAMDLLTSRMQTRTQTATTSYVMEKIYGNPESHALVFHLYAGPSYPSPPLSYPPAIPQEPIHIDMLSSNVDIDIAQLEAICSHNAFVLTSLEQPNFAHGGQPQHTSNNASDEEGAGLYLLPSLFNHACAANATRCCIGDVMLIRATESIRTGDEITIPYSNNISYEKRAKDLQHWLPNGCDCWLCGEDRKDTEDARLRRDKLAEELEFDRLRRSSLARVRFLEKQIAATYSSFRGPIKPLMASAQHAIAEVLRIQIDSHVMKEAVAEDKRALQSLGFVLLDERSTGASPASANSLGLPITTDRIPSATSFSEPTFIILGMVQSMLQLKDEANAVKWLKAALWILDMSVGGGKNFFMAFMDSTLQYLGLKKFAKRVL